MLVLSRRLGESLILTFPDDLDTEPVTVTVLDNGNIGIDAPDEVEIVRAELLDSPPLS